MQGRAEAEEFDRLLNMSRVEMPLLRQGLELSAGNQLKAARLGQLPAARANGHGVKTS